MESCKVGYSSIIGTKRKSFSEALIAWYERCARDLPWRRTRDPYRIWVSEIMLQQTRVEAVLPYYARFLEKYPDIERLAAADEQELLTVWAGLGYYSRPRNMQRAAKLIVAAGRFPVTYDAIRELPGIGDYTAAAVASIAFDLPHAVLDGNVMRVMARITHDDGDIRSSTTKARLQAAAAARLDRSAPGTFNQAVMELGATVCIPADPKCLLCPVQQFCDALAAGRQCELPVKSQHANRRAEDVVLLVVRRDSRILLWQQPAESRRLAGFWELPQATMLPQAVLKEPIGEFKHSITNTDYRVVVRAATLSKKPPRFVWVATGELWKLPFSTMSKKALRAALGHG
jgi:A/G-specific adenine glycosylase